MGQQLKENHERCPFSNFAQEGTWVRSTWEDIEGFISTNCWLWNPLTHSPDNHLAPVCSGSPYQRESRPWLQDLGPLRRKVLPPECSGWVQVFYWWRMEDRARESVPRHKITKQCIWAALSPKAPCCATQTVLWVWCGAKIGGPWRLGLLVPLLGKAGADISERQKPWLLLKWL